MVVNRIIRFGSHSKIAICWIISGTVCLSGYMLARAWVRQHRYRALKVRQDLNEEFGIEKLRARAKVNDSTQD